MGLRFKRDNGSEYSKINTVPLNKCASFHSGLTYKPEDVTKDDSGTVVIRSTNIQNNQLVYDDVVRVSIPLKDSMFPKVNDIIMCVRNGSKALVGKNAVVEEKDLGSTWGAFMTLIRSNENNRYIYYFLNSPLFNKHINADAGTSTINQITSKMFHSCYVNLPCVEEQQKIASFLSSVDEVIAVSEEEVKNLEEQKKGMMQKLFSQEARFRKDDGSEYPEWGTIQLSEITKRVTRRNTNNESGLAMTISSVDGLVDQLEYFNKTVASKDLSNYYLLYNGEFAYNKSASKGYDYGSIKRLDRYPMGVLSSLYICFSLSTSVNSDFMCHYFDSMSWNTEVASRCAEGARNHGLLNISPADFFDISIVIPLEIEEQQKIASFLSAFDDAIVAAKEELECWKDIKKGLLQQLFEQEEE